MIVNAILIFVIAVSIAYFLYRAYINTQQILKNEQPCNRSISRDEILELIEDELEEKIRKLLEDKKRLESYEKDEYFELKGNSKTFPKLKVVK